MKRFMFALGLVMTIAASESDAAYLIIRIVLEGGTLEPAATPGQGQPAVPPVPKSGNSSSPQSGGPGPGPKGGSGIGPPGGGSGIGPPGGGIGPKGGSSGGPPPGVGGSGGMPPPLSGSGTGGGPLTPGGPVASHDPTRSIYVVVPYTNDIEKKVHFYKKAPPQSWNPFWQPAIKHAFGSANLIDDNTSTQLYLDLGPSSPKLMKTKFTDLIEKHAKLSTSADAQLLLDLVNQALENGFVPEAVKYSDELSALVADKKARTTPQVDRFLGAYAKIKDDLARPSRSPSDGPAWKERIGFAYSGVKDFSAPHYHMLYWEGMDAEMQRRAGQLEDNFKAFFLSHALRGIALQVPEKPQVVILAKSTGDVRRLSASLDGSPAVADGFYSPEHGLVVLSPERLDAVSQTFNRQIQDMFRQGVGRAQLLAGEGPKIDDKGITKDSKKSEDVARMMTWVVAERFAEEEGEWSTVSREGTRQLLHVSGLLPKHVSLPLWLSEGSASFYHRPKGPVFSRRDGKDHITVALTTGYGVPNYVRQKQFMELFRLGQFSIKTTDKPDAGQIVRNVVSDAYFAASLAGVDADNAKLPLPPAAPKPIGPMVGAVAPPPTEDPIVVKRRRTEFLASKAQATAWSLYYFLAKSNPAGLDRYIAELSKMPRDLPLGESSRLTAFATALNLSLDGKKTGNQITIEELGTSWLQFMETIPAAGIEVPLVDLAAGSATSTGGPAPPGGGPGPLGPPKGM